MRFRASITIISSFLLLFYLTTKEKLLEAFLNKIKIIYFLNGHLIWPYNKTGELSFNLMEFWQVKQIYPEKHVQTIFVNVSKFKPYLNRVKPSLFFYICIKLVYPKYPIHQHVFQAKAFTVYPFKTLRFSSYSSNREPHTSLYTTHTRHLATCK